MSRPYYIGYTEHMFRLYYHIAELIAEGETVTFNTPITEKCFDAVKNYLTTVSGYDKRLLQHIYALKLKTTNECVTDTAECFKLEQKVVWKIISVHNNALANFYGLK